MELNWRPFFNPILYPVRSALLLLLIGALWIGARVYVAYLLAPVSPDPQGGKNIVITIKRGASLSEVGELLEQKKLIKSKNFFVLYALLTGREKRIQAGEYRISNAWPLQKILALIVGGEVILHRVAIPEGYTVTQIEKLLVEKGIVDQTRFRKALSSEDFSLPFLAGAPEGPRRLEGFLFPATYEFPAGLTEKEILALMLQRFRKAFTPELQRRAQAMGLSIREVVTLASLVEREAKLEAERPIIAAVFLNRLRCGMRLESCATIQYILGKQKEKLTQQDLRISSSYNTYLHDGLPPGPIANPGLASIKAVLYPAEVDYLYFVARGDGSHHFSRTLGEHQTAARRYLHED